VSGPLLRYSGLSHRETKPKKLLLIANSLNSSKVAKRDHLKIKKKSLDSQDLTGVGI
jgi:hypothetical protein